VLAVSSFCCAPGANNGYFFGLFFMIFVSGTTSASFIIAVISLIDMLCSASARAGRRSR
jgi:hypothetical protein